MKEQVFIKEQIENKKWTLDCQGKQDLDMPILSISTRYWPDFTAKPSFILGVDSYSEENVESRTILEPKNYIKGKNEEDCKRKVKQWYKRHLKDVIQKLMEE